MTIQRAQSETRTLVEQLWESPDGCLSVQVLQEFFVNVTRKIAKPLSAEAVSRTRFGRRRPDRRSRKPR